MDIMVQSKSKIFDLFKIFLIGILLSGCLNSQKADFPSIAPSVTRAVATATPLPTGKPSPSQTPSSTDTPEPPPGVDQSKCVVITQAPLQQLQGTLVLEHVISFDLRDILFLDLETHQERFISKQGGEYYGSETVSPAGTYFATETFTFLSLPERHSQQGPIQIFNSEGNLVATVDLKQESYGFRWLNEEQIIMNYPYDDGNPVILISPFKRTQKKIQPFIKNYNFSDKFIMEWGFYGGHKNVYDPHMTRMLYPSSNENGPTVVLRDLEKGIDLASYSTSRGRGNWPTWSVDGEKLAIALNIASGSDIFYKYEIFVINRNGEKLLTTNLTSLSETVHITNLSWSPNGRYLAFWYTNDENHLDVYLQLAVLDTVTQAITNYCISNADDLVRFSPIWSPTSDYLLIAYRAPGDKVLSSLLLNILDGKASIIKSDFEPLGWLK